MKKTSALIQAAILPFLVSLCVLFPLAVQPGCMGTGSRTLDPEGPYAGDAFLFSVDQIIAEMGASIKLVEDVAARNPVVAARPEVAQVLASIHLVRDGRVDRKADGTIEAYEVEAILIMARDAYKDARTQANAEKVTDALKLANLLLSQVRQVLPAFVAQ